MVSQDLWDIFPSSLHKADMSPPLPKVSRCPLLSIVVYPKNWRSALFVMIFSKVLIDPDLIPVPLFYPGLFPSSRSATASIDQKRKDIGHCLTIY
jgi:hypothetical protein